MSACGEKQKSPISSMIKVRPSRSEAAHITCAPGTCGSPPWLVDAALLLGRMLLAGGSADISHETLGRRLRRGGFSVSCQLLRGSGCPVEHGHGPAARLAARTVSSIVFQRNSASVNSRTPVLLEDRLGLLAPPHAVEPIMDAHVQPPISKLVDHRKSQETFSAQRPSPATVRPPLAR